MELINKLEKAITTWLRPLPNLPKDAKKWISENVWWIATVGLIASIIGLLISLSSIIRYLTFTPTIYYGAYVTTSYIGPSIANLTLSAVFSIVIILLTAFAIQPLKRRELKGWRLSFIIVLLSALFSLINIITLSILSLIYTIVVLAVSLYLLVQVRSYFGSTLRAKHIQKAPGK